MPIANYRTNLVHSTLLIILPLLLIWPVSLGIYTMKWDMVNYFLPHRMLISDCIQHGMLPAWNPYQNLGAPMYGDPQSGFWYPITWLCSITFGYSAYVIGLEYLLHLAIAGLGFYWLIRRLQMRPGVALLFAIAYQFNGVFISNAQHLSWVISASWLPWVMLGFIQLIFYGKKRSLSLTTLALYLMLSGGYPIYFLITAGFLAVLTLVKVVQLAYYKDTGTLKHVLHRSGLLIIIFSLLSASWFVSVFSILPHISRSIPLSLEQAQNCSFTPASFLSILWPAAVASNGKWFDSDVSMINAYFGIIPLLFLLPAVFKQKPFFIRAFFMLSVVSLLLAVGDVLPFRAWAYYIIPYFDKFRFPALFRLFFILGGLITGAWYLDGLLAEKTPWPKVSLAIIAVIVIAGTIYAFTQTTTYHLGVSNFLFSWTAVSGVYERMAVQGLFQFFIVALIAIVLLKVSSNNTRLKLMIMILILDFFVVLITQVPATVVADTHLSALDSKLSERPRGFPPPENQIIDALCIHDKTYAPIWYNQGMITKKPCYDSWNPFRLKLLQQVDDDPILSQHQMPEASANSGARVTITQFNPAGIQLSVTVDRPDTLTVAQVNFNTWKSRVNDHESEILRGTYPLVRVPLQAGTNQVELNPVPAWLKPLFVFTIVLFALYLLTGLYLWKV